MLRSYVVDEEERSLIQTENCTRCGSCESGSGMKNHGGSSREGLELETVKKSSEDFRLLLSAVTWVLMSCSCGIMNCAEALPFPAPNLQNCRSSEGCCTPALSARSRKFQFQSDLPLRIRRAAHLVDEAYIAKYQRATELMRALPDSDGRSFLNQYKLHCVYCDNNLYFEGSEGGEGGEGGDSYPLEIHRSWLFYPWHRLYLYFHERILATLIDDDTFALPFWNWDDQSPAAPQGNVVPRVYAEARSLENSGAINATSALYDPDRTACAHWAEGFVDFQNTSACPPRDKDGTEARAANAHVMYMNMVGVGVTPLLFHGFPYRFGDEGGGGEGALEAVPHGAVHGWVNVHDMLGFKDSASDPLFYAHHANMDRLWELWKTLPGGVRSDIADPDYLHTEFAFYDEDGGIVTVSVAQALQIDQLRYKYEEVPNAWLENDRENAHICNPKNSPAELAALVEATQPFAGPVNFTTGPLTFKVRRRRPRESDEAGEEILELRGDVDYGRMGVGEMLALGAFAFHPAARADESLGCAEFLGVRWLFTHVGISPRYPRQDVWRMGIRHQLRLMGTEHLDHLVVTVTGSAASRHGIVFTNVSVIYSQE